MNFFKNIVGLFTKKDKRDKVALPPVCIRPPYLRKNGRFKVKYLYSVQGKRFTIAQSKELFGIDQGTVKYRLRNGWTILEAFTTPSQHRVGNKYTVLKDKLNQYVPKEEEAKKVIDAANNLIKEGDSRGMTRTLLNLAVENAINEAIRVNDGEGGAIGGGIKIEVVPSERIDNCSDCGGEHGYDCPKQQELPTDKLN